jgi:pre-mRNA-processing factor 40
MLGNPGSNPLELFWDVVDRLDQVLDAKISVVEDAIRKYRGRRKTETAKDVKGMDIDDQPLVSPQTSMDEFKYLVEAAFNDQDSSALSDSDLSEIFLTASRYFCIMLAY